LLSREPLDNNVVDLLTELLRTKSDSLSWFFLFATERKFHEPVRLGNSVDHFPA